MPTGPGDQRSRSVTSEIEAGCSDGLVGGSESAFVVAAEDKLAGLEGRAAQPAHGDDDDPTEGWAGHPNGRAERSRGPYRAGRHSSSLARVGSIRMSTRLAKPFASWEYQVL